MKKNIAIVTVTVVSLIVLASLFVYSEINTLQNEASALKAENEETENQLDELNNQLSELQLQNREQHDRLCDFTYELAEARYVKVEISDFVWIGGFNPVGGLLLGYPVNVTIQNNDVVPLSGLKLRALLVRENTGADYGTPGGATIERLNPGEKEVIRCEPWVPLNMDLNNSVCMVTLKIGDIVLDKGSYSIS
jgi:hypothetical protein